MRIAGAQRNLVWLRLFGHQLDYRSDGWLPLSVHEGRRAWNVLPLGRLGCITYGRMTNHPSTPPGCAADEKASA